MTSIKFVDLLSEIRKQIFNNKQDIDNEHLKKLLIQLHSFDKNRQITLHKRDYYSNLYKNQKINGLFDIVDNVVIFKNEFNTIELKKLEYSMLDILDTFDVIYNNGSDEDVYTVACKLFNVPGHLIKDEVEQLNCII